MNETSGSEAGTGRDLGARRSRPSGRETHGLPYTYAPIRKPETPNAAATVGARFRYLMETAPMTAFMKDAAGRFLYANPHMLATVGRRMGSDWRGKTAADFWSADLAARIRADDEAVLRDGAFKAFTQVMPFEDGPHTFLLMKFPLATDDGRINLGGVGVDVTHQSNTASQRDRITAAVEQVTESVVITDLESRIIYINPAFERATGYSRAELIGRNPRLIKSGLQPQSFYEAMWAALKSGVPWVTNDLINRRKDGSLFTEESVISPIRDASGEVTGYVSVSRDVTAERALAEHAVQFVRERALIAETIRGLRAGDTLEATAQAICRQVVNLTGIAAAQFLVFEMDGYAMPIGQVVSGRPDPPLQRLSRQLGRGLAGRAAEGPWVEPWMNRPGNLHDQLVAGVGPSSLAFAPVHYDERLIGLLAIESIDAVDKAATTEALPALVEFANLAGALVGRDLARRANMGRVHDHISGIIKRRAFLPVFQPIVKLEGNATVGYEALTRFTDGSNPEVVFTEASQVGLALELETAALSAALTAAKALPESAWLNVNASPEVILAGEPLRTLLRRSRRHLVLEVTEHVVIADYPAFRAAMVALGPDVELAVDDAGAGFASLRHILELHPAFVKLDRSLVAGLETDSARQAMIVGLRHFARTTGCRLIAEGVETDAELTILRNLGIGLGQGYLLGRPVPVGDTRNTAA
jgi:PAS domain S-box-containing protein